MMSLLRKERGLSQRKAASELKISQALLSHYENGAREPGLGFVCRACDYYGVSADFLLGRSAGAHGAGVSSMSDLVAQLKILVEQAEAGMDSQNPAH